MSCFRRNVYANYLFLRMYKGFDEKGNGKLCCIASYIAMHQQRLWNVATNLPHKTKNKLKC